jgi:hypothetical protein
MRGVMLRGTITGLLPSSATCVFLTMPDHKGATNSPKAMAEDCPQAPHSLEKRSPATREGVLRLWPVDTKVGNVHAGPIET